MLPLRSSQPGIPAGIRIWMMEAFYNTSMRQTAILSDHTVDTCAVTKS